MSVEPTATPTSRPRGRRFRPSWPGGLALLTVLAIVGVVVANQTAFTATDRDAQERLALIVRAGGQAALFLLAVLVCLGLVLSHPTNDRTWRFSRLVFPWHRHLWVFVLAFVALHSAGVILDPFARVTIVGALIPGSSSYRSLPVALGTLALYAFLITTLSATYPKRLPRGAWLVIHRVSVAVFTLAWLHGVLVGDDTGGLAWLYAATGGAVLLAGAHRLWAAHQRRPTFTTSFTRPGSQGSRP
jgi:predicted ferric reductase